MRIHSGTHTTCSTQTQAGFHESQLKEGFRTSTDGAHSGSTINGVFRVPHQPRPVDDLVQLQSDEDELQNIYWTQHLQLRRRRRSEKRSGQKFRTVLIFNCNFFYTYLTYEDDDLKPCRKCKKKQPVLLETKRYAGKRYTAGQWIKTQDLHTARSWIPSTNRKHFPWDHFLLFHTHTWLLKKCDFTVLNLIMQKEYAEELKQSLTVALTATDMDQAFIQTTLTKDWWIKHLRITKIWIFWHWILTHSWKSLTVVLWYFTISFWVSS